MKTNHWHRGLLIRSGIATGATLITVAGTLLGILGISPNFFEKNPSGQVLSTCSVSYTFNWSQVNDPDANSLFFDLKKSTDADL